MLNGGISGCTGNVNSINDYSSSLQVSGGGAGVSNGVTSTNITDRHDSTASNWMTNHTHSHSNNKINAGNTSAGHWGHSTSPTCMPNVLDSSSFGAGTGHMSSLSAPNTTDPFGFVSAHSNELKPAFYYTSQFGPGIRGLAL